MAYTREKIQSLLSIIDNVVFENKAEEPLVEVLKKLQSIFNNALVETSRINTLVNDNSKAQAQAKFEQEMSTSLDEMSTKLITIKDNKDQRTNSRIADRLMAQIQTHMEYSNNSFPSVTPVLSNDNEQ